MHEFFITGTTPIYVGAGRSILASWVHLVFPLEFCEPNLLVFLGIVSQVQSYFGVEYRDGIVACRRITFQVRIPACNPYREGCRPCNPGFSLYV